KIIVHPECTPDVVRLSDSVGSTSFIKTMIEQAEPGSRWAVGTELNFVNRLRKENPAKTIVPLMEWTCHEMSKTTALHLMNTLEALVQKNPSPEVRVDPEIAEYAGIALDRMLEIN
ncbi:MAG TPA: quinolinate synthase NadA, partial [Syntrophorhabdaceae bacterium]|nr:quinolinate synthase NadA [Syntrophorhabdaceae bacterium]